MALDPNKKKPLDPPIGYATGQALRTGLGNALDSGMGLAARTTAQLAAPALVPAALGANATRGFVGASPVAAAPVVAPRHIAPPVPTPAPAVVTPARPPVIPASQAGASAPAGGGAAPRPLNLGASANFGGGGAVTDSLASSVNKGVPTYDNASIAKLNARNANPATSAVQSFGGATTPLAMPQAQTPNLDVNLPRPATADPYNVRQADEQRKALLSSFDSQQFANSLAAQRGSRGALALQASLNNTAADLSGQGLRTAADIASGDRDTSARYDLTGVDQNGQNQRALLQDQGDTTRTGLQQAGENQRSLLTTQADLLKPTQITDADGNVFNVVGGKPTPMVGPDGRQIKGAPTKADGAITPQVAANLAVEQLKAEQASMQPDPVRIAALQQQIAQYTPGGNVATSGPPAAAIALLKGDPSKAALFDQKYGKGASARYIK